MFGQAGAEADTVPMGWALAGGSVVGEDRGRWPRTPPTSQVLTRARRGPGLEGQLCHGRRHLVVSSRGSAARQRALHRLGSHGVSPPGPRQLLERHHPSYCSPPCTQHGGLGAAPLSGVSEGLRFLWPS